MKIKKLTNKIDEVLDSDNNLIGYDDTPRAGGGLESQASSTTDYNAKISRQPFRYDMLGRFGFTLFPFFEGEDSDKDLEFLNEVAGLMYETYKKTLEYYYKSPNKLKPHHRKTVKDESYNSEALEKIGKDLQEVLKTLVEKRKNKIEESSVHEDSILKEKNKKWIEKKEKDKEVLDKDIKKVAGLLNNFDKEELDELIKLLEV